MPLKSNITDRRHRREKFKREITLISGGFAKPDAFPGGKITVYPWDSSVEAWLTDVAIKATGPDRDRILYDLMTRICNLNGCPLDDFVVGDVNTVLMVSRSIGNMNQIQYLVICPKCGHEETCKILIPDELKPVGKKSPEYPGYDTVILDDCKDAVDIRPLRIKDELAITGRPPEQKQQISNHTAHVIGPVISVNKTQPDSILELLEWFNSLSPHDAKQLEEAIDAHTPHLSQDLIQKCDECGTVWKHRLLLDQDFFRSGRIGVSREALATDL